MTNNHNLLVFFYLAIKSTTTVDITTRVQTTGLEDKGISRGVVDDSDSGKQIMTTNLSFRLTRESHSALGLLLLLFFFKGGRRRMCERKKGGGLFVLDLGVGRQNRQTVSCTSIGQVFATPAEEQ